MHEAKRRRQRRMWIIFILLLLAGGGYLGYRISVGPLMQPVTVRQFATEDLLYFSCNGPGYPAIQAVADGKPNIRYMPPFYPFPAQWLADDGNALPGSFYYLNDLYPYPGIRPSRDVVLARFYNGPGSSFSLVKLAWRDGRRDNIQAHPELRTPVSPQGYSHYCEWYDMLCDSPRYTAYLSGTGGSALLYDIKERRALFTLRRSNYQDPGMVFHQEKRFLLIQYTGYAQVFEGKRRLGRFGTSNTRWCWGEDGTAWTVENGVAKVLRWRESPPRLISADIKVFYDDRICGIRHPKRQRILVFGSPPPASYPPYFGDPAYNVALWDDGRITARMKTLRLIPGALDNGLSSLGKHVTGLRALPRQARRLELFRGGKLIGCFTVRLDPTSGMKRTAPAGTPLDVLTSEHLAFTGDGRYLSWVIETGKGKTLYVFRVP